MLHCCTSSGFALAHALSLQILKKWGADAIRDCDGTDFPQELKDADAKIYSTYYTSRSNCSRI